MRVKLDENLSSDLAGLLRDAGLIRQVVEAVATRDPTGQLWIVEPGFVRIHEPDE